MPNEPDTARLPPHDIAAEQAVLGSCLLEGEAAGLAVEKLRSRDFFRASHRLVFRAIMDLGLKGDMPDEVLVAERLGKAKKLDEVGGERYLHELCLSTPSAANIERYAEIVKEMSQRRRLIEAAGVTMREAESPGITEDVVERAQERFTGIGLSSGPAEPISIGEVIMQAAGKDEEVWQMDFLAPLQEFIGGIYPGGFVLLAGGEGAGKTTLAMQLLVSVAQSGERVYVWSADQTLKRVGFLTWSGMAKIPISKLWDEGSESLADVTGLPLYFDQGHFALDTVSATMRREASKGTRWFALDYLSLLDVSKNFRADWEAAVYAGGRMKLLAQQLNAYLLILQSATEQESDKTVRARYVYGGRQLRHHADQVWFLQQPDLADREEAGRRAAKPTILHVLKNRNGPPCKIKLDFRGAWHRFDAWHE